MKVFVLRALAVLAFLLAIGALLATLAAAQGEGRSPGLFSAVILGGMGSWLWGRARGDSARAIFGRAIEVKHEGAPDDDGPEPVENESDTRQEKR